MHDKKRTGMSVTTTVSRPLFSVCACVCACACVCVCVCVCEKSDRDREGVSLLQGGLLQNMNVCVCACVCVCDVTLQRENDHQRAEEGEGESLVSDGGGERNGRHPEYAVRTFISLFFSPLNRFFFTITIECDMYSRQLCT